MAKLSYICLGAVAVLPLSLLAMLHARHNRLALRLRLNFCARAEKVARGQKGKLGCVFAAVVALILESGQVAAAKLTLFFPGVRKGAWLENASNSDVLSWQRNRMEKY